jgi:predicted dehydrogenase
MMQESPAVEMGTDVVVWVWLALVAASRRTAFLCFALVKPDLRTWSDPRRGGGYAHGQLTHALGLLFRITELGADEVYCTVFKSRTGVYQSLAMTCQFECGATGCISGSRALSPGSPFQVDLRIFGTEGTLLVDIERPRVQVFRLDRRNSKHQVPLVRGAYPQAAPVHTFVRLVPGGTAENRSDAAVGERVVEVLDAALRSAGSRAAVRVEQRT